ncbi:auxin efflux carrier [Rhodofomes roseus]|uniref:Auxin efflux carrier n=1 Tax=Rhodofomes roseus TaxID=34475 RepID=A0ABQ8K9D1_9APHY|nr:auxin efflux carrier [Rhodofomes roseus]KAH9833843.1 auxin efflux carrier [Rhodofomes roseus]
MPSAGYLIYCGIMPLLKTFIAIFVGYFLGKKGLFTAEASKGASQVSMNISLPALIFANVVPAFTSQNVSALGPLFLTAFSYLGFGFTFGLIIREICYVPRNFWQGIVVLCAMSNWGNLPTAIVEAVMQEAPFNRNSDPALGVSFVSVFIVSYHLVFWVGGAARSLAWDYLPGVPQGAEAERRLAWHEKPIGGFIARYVLHLKVASPAPVYSEKADGASVSEKGPMEMEKGKDVMDDLEANLYASLQAEQPELGMVEEDHAYETDPDVQLARRTSRLSITSNRSRRPSLLAGISPSLPQPPATPPPSVLHSSEQANVHEHPSSYFARLQKTLRPLSAAVTPITVSLVISLPIALITNLKALFVNTTNQGGPAWYGPDGNPPLNFIYVSAQFLGEIAVPLSLILLGASFARMQIPRPLSRLPIMAMLAAALAKMVLLPVIGVFLIQGMVKGGLIPREALAERFVAMFLSGTPPAVNQLIVSSLYSTTGDVDTLSAFLLIQYIVMFFSSAALTAVSLLLL